jgi:predicted transcriptional regulator
MFAYFSKLNNLNSLNNLNKLNCVSLLLLNNYDSDDSNIEDDDEYQFNNYTIARWAKEYNFMIMHPYNIVVREDIPPLFSYS